MIVNPARAIQHCRDMLCLLEEEGEEDMKAYTIFNDAFRIATAHSDFARAHVFMNLVMKRRIFCRGSDYHGLNQDQEEARTPETQSMAGMSTYRSSEAKDAQTEAQHGYEEWLWARVG